MSAVTQDYRAPGAIAVAQEFIETPFGFKHLVLKPVIQMLNWVKWGYGLTEPAQKAHKLFKRSNSVFGWAGFPGKLKKIRVAVTKFNEAFQAGSPSTELGLKAGFVGVRVAELVSFGAGIVNLFRKEEIIALSAFQQECINTIGIVGAGAALISSINDGYTHFQEMQKLEVGCPKYNLALSKTIAKIIAVVTSVLGLIGFSLGFSLVAEWVFLSLATASLILALGNHFYKKMVVEPLENKG